MIDEPGNQAPRPHSGTGSIGRWAAIAALCFLVFVTARLPAGLATRVLDASGAQAQLLDASGTLWSGRGNVYAEGQHIGTLAWQWRPSALARLELAADVQFQRPGLDLSGIGALDTDGLTHLRAVQGSLTQELVDSVLGVYDINVPGAIQLHDVHVSARQQTIVDAAGGATWAGGTVEYRLAGRTWYAELPALRANLGTRDGVATLEMLSPREEPLLDLSLRPDGWADIRVRARFVEMAGFPWEDPPAPDVVVLELSEQIARR